MNYVPMKVLSLWHEGANFTIFFHNSGRKLTPLQGAAGLEEE